MNYQNKLLSYNPVFHWFGPYSAPANIFTAPLAAGFPYTQGTLILWVKKSDWAAAGTQLAIDFNRDDPYSDIRVRKSAANTVAMTYSADGSSRTLTGAASGVDFLPLIFQWDTIGKAIYAKINFAAKQTVAVPGIVALSTLTVATLLSTFVGELQNAALYDTLLSDTVLADLEVSVADKGKSVFTLMDYDGEKTAVQVHHVALTAGNYAATETLLDALRDAIAQITLGTLVQTRYGNEDFLSITVPNVEEAQREKKWLVSYHDTTSLLSYSVEIGTADEDLLDDNDRKHAQIGDAGFVDGFITAFEAVAKSPTGGAVAVDEITLVFRNV